METQDQVRINILVVDDDRIDFEAVAPILKKEGYAVHHASGGRQCLERAAQVRPDLILIAVDGPQTEYLETCRQVKADPVLQSIPVVFMMPNSNSLAVEDAYHSGASDLIRKPFNRIELLARIDLLLKLQQAMKKTDETATLGKVLETAGGICHSLNQPLQFVLGAVQILLMDMSEADKDYKSLDKIREKVEQMGDITRKLAALTRSHAKSQ